MKNLVVGAGFSGAVIANLIATKLNEKVVVIDKKQQVNFKMVHVLNGCILMTLIICQI